MTYTFEILGVSPVLQFFNHEQEAANSGGNSGVAYLSSYRCTLDALIQSVEVISPKHGWQPDSAIDTVIRFWMRNADTIQYWKQRLDDAGSQNLLVSRMADLRSLRCEFESLLELD